MGVRLATKKPSGRPFTKGHGKLGGRKKGTPNVVTRDLKEFLKSFVENDVEYQENLRERLRAGKTPHMKLLAAHYSGGKPKDTHEVTTPTLSNLLKLALSKPEAGG